MSKHTPDATLDAQAALVAAATRIDLVSDESTPTDLSNTLANKTLTPGIGNGDYSIADGATSGRTLTLATQNEVAITAGGTARHWVLSLGGVIKEVGTCTPQVLVAGGTVDIPAINIEYRDPT